MSEQAALVLVRHADTEFTEKGLLHGSLDSPLSEGGLEQARRTAERLRGTEFDALYSSPLGRSLSTATIIGEAISLEPVPEPGLAERDFGWMEGKPLPKPDANPLLRQLFRLLIRTSFALSGEGLTDFDARIGETVRKILGRHPHDLVLIVTHWGVLSMIMHQLLGGDRGEWLGSANWGPCSITEVRRADGAWEALRVNDREHLVDEG